MDHQHSQVIVAKFGGTSMGSFSAMLQSAYIVSRDLPKIIVVSAVSGITDQLTEMAKNSSDDLKISEIKNKHFAILEQMSLYFKPMDQQFEKYYHDILGPLYHELDFLFRSLEYALEAKDINNQRKMSEILCFGERLSSVLFYAVLRLHFLQQNIPVCHLHLIRAEDVIKTNSNDLCATPNVELIKKQVKEKIHDHHIYLTQGFIGCNDRGESTTLGRGGSDYTAALLAEALKANLLQIWTDVPGVATTDPRHVSHVRFLKELSYSEAIEMANAGAKVLHPRTLLPAIREEIPVFVGSTFEPERQGTIIKKKVGDRPLVRAMAMKKNLLLLTLTLPVNTKKVFQLFQKYQYSLESSCRSRTTLSLIIDKALVPTQNWTPFLEELHAIAEYQIEDEVEQIALISNSQTSDLRHLISQELMKCLTPEIKIKFWRQQGSQLKLFVTKEQRTQVVQKVHDLFLTQQENL